MTQVPTGMLEFLCCPLGRDDLRLESSGLVSVSTPHRIYRVHEGIPILLPPAGSRQQSANADPVIRAFEGRAASYYADNYMPGMNAQRSKRLELVRGLLSQLARPGDRLLDVGAGPAILGEVARSQRLEYVAVDLSLENLLVGRSRMGQLSGIVATATALPVKDRSFDGVVSLGCLEYVDHLEAAVAELCRTVRPGGFLLVSFANRRSPRCWWDEHVTYPLWRLRERTAGRASTLYGRYLRNEHEVEEMFAQCGAKLLRNHYFNPGLLGYPLSAIPLVASMEERAADRIEIVRRRAAEFLVVAVREEEG
jgi:ubiquinone/menaquinone biosynthesis C-methylase UbiE